MLVYADDVPNIRITVDGKLALTVEQAADRYAIAHSSMRAALTRLKADEKIDEAAKLDGRKPLFLATALDKAMKDRPGKGAPGMKRQRKSG